MVKVRLYFRGFIEYICLGCLPTMNLMSSVGSPEISLVGAMKLIYKKLMTIVG